jgi:hypothetical protein
MTHGTLILTNELTLAFVRIEFHLMISAQLLAK